MKRFAENILTEWFKRKHRKPLVIRGARQVGKSTLVRNFAHNYDLVLYEINLERNLKLRDLFASFNVKNIFDELEFITGKGKISEKSLIFLDEIQALPEAIQCLRYFYEDYPNVAVIAAGSLLEFALSNSSFSMPVGRIEYLYLGPVSFEEFLEASGENELLKALRNHDLTKYFPNALHESAINLLKTYLLIGGMPEAAQRYMETKDFVQAFDVQISIIETYKDDFAKYGSSADLVRLHKVFDYVPVMAGDKIKYSNIDPFLQARELKKAVDLLFRAGVLTKVFHSHASGIPLKALTNEKVFKTYFLDCGLMNRICGISRISDQALLKNSFINEGRVAEQFVAQHLLYSGRSNEKPTLTYWLRENRSANAEVDFVCQFNDQIVPIEVKAGKSGTLKSLQQFLYLKQLSVAVRFDMNPPSKQHISHLIRVDKGTVQVEFDLISLPLYMVEQMERVLLGSNRSA